MCQSINTCYLNSVGVKACWSFIKVVNNNFLKISEKKKKKRISEK